MQKFKKHFPLCLSIGVAVILWTDDTAAAYNDLVAGGAPPLASPHVWLGRLLIAWTADPDGNPIQIVQPLAQST